MAGLGAYHRVLSKGAKALDRWNRVVGEYYSSAVVYSDARDFRARLQHCEFEDLQINWVKALQSTVQRWVTGEAFSRTGTAFLHLQAAGHSINRQFGREVLINPGEAVVCDPDTRYEVDFRTPYEMLVVEVPLSRIKSRRPEFDLEDAGALRVNPSLSRLLLSFLSGAWNQIELFGDDPEWRESVGRIGLDLAISAMVGLSVEKCGRGRRRLNRDVLEYIGANLTDQDLKTSSIARALGVSPRSVQSVFERMSATASGYILDQRLRLAKTLLRDDSRRTSITAVAYDCGFNDSAYFSRSFRKRFGITPRDYSRGNGA